MAIEEEDYPRRRSRVVREVREDEPFVESRVVTDDGYRDTRFAVVYYLLNIVEALLLLRLVMKLLGANAGNGFVNGIYTITNPLVSPFAGIFHTPVTSAGTVVEWSTIVAMIVYALIAYAIVQLLRIATRATRTV